MNASFTLTCAEADISLRTITEADLEILRQWKNTQRFSFFYQDIITPEQQRRWYQGYLARPDDYMFIVVHAGQAIGCIGYRLLEGAIDIYNVILGDPAAGKRGWMSQALRLMCSYIIAHFTRDIIAQVLTTNPAIGWYEKNNFFTRARHETHVEMKLDLVRFAPCRFVRTDSNLTTR